MADPRPAISVVAVSRNDDHGVNLHRRMQTFVNALIGQCKKHDLHAELILVEWNPPADRAKLAQSLRWFADPRPCEVRIIEVPGHLHKRYRHADALPFFQMIGKNVGIRRARGEYVLCTNIDILFSDELVQFLKHGPLKAGAMYRIDRSDVGPDVPVDASITEQIEYCEANLLRLNGPLTTYPVMRLADGTRVYLLERDDIARAGAGIYLQDWYELEKDRLGRQFRWAFDGAAILLQPPAGSPRRLLLEILPGPGSRFGSFELEVRDEKGRSICRGQVPPRRSLIKLDLPLDPNRCQIFRLHSHGGGLAIPSDPRILDYAAYRLEWDEPGTGGSGKPFDAVRVSRSGAVAATTGLGRQGRYLLQDLKALATRSMRRLRQSLSHRKRFVPAQIHTNACGDFTLLKREHWFDLRGYAELEMYSMHIDSLFCYAAHYSGIKEVRLQKPMFAYHIEHSAGSGWTPDGESQLYERLSRRGIPYLTIDDLYRWAEKMHLAGHGRLFNDHDWGLAKEQLPETRIGSATSAPVAA